MINHCYLYLGEYLFIFAQLCSLKSSEVNNTRPHMIIVKSNIEQTLKTWTVKYKNKKTYFL